MLSNSIDRYWTPPDSVIDVYNRCSRTSLESRTPFRRTSFGTLACEYVQATCKSQFTRHFPPSIQAFRLKVSNSQTLCLFEEGFSNRRFLFDFIWTFYSIHPIFPQVLFKSPNQTVESTVLIPSADDTEVSWRSNPHRSNDRWSNKKRGFFTHFLDEETFSLSGASEEGSWRRLSWILWNIEKRPFHKMILFPKFRQDS